MRKSSARQLTTHTIRVNNFSIRYQRIGEGQPLVLVHGLSGSTRWWIRNVESLSEHHCVYLIDLPGFGAMHQAHTQFALLDAGNWLLQWMKAVGIQRADLIGHSMGGFVCLWVAAHHPDMVSQLILISPAIRHEQRSIWGYIPPLLKAIRYLTLHFLLILSWDSIRMGPVTLLNAANSLLHISLEEEIKTVIAPTLLVWGEGDTLEPLALGHILRHDMLHARLLVIPGAGHVSMFDHPQLFNQAANDFLDGQMVGA